MNKNRFRNVRLFLVILTLVASAQVLNAYNSSNEGLLESSTLLSDGTYKDGRIIVAMVKEDGADVKYRFLESDIGGLKFSLLKSDVEELMREGRYIKSITPTKFGTLVVDEPNIKNIPQMFTTINTYPQKKGIEKKFKEGWSLTYYILWLCNI